MNETLDDLATYELQEKKREIEKELFERRKNRMIDGLKNEIERVRNAKDDFELNKTPDIEFDYTHR